MPVARHILPVIVLAQFCCTSLWFASNGVMHDLILDFSLRSTAMGHLTAAVQFGFITGTLVFALLTIPDRFAPSRVFFACALIGALLNLLLINPGNTLASMVFIRFATGFFLAGIYPVGMKIAADYYEKGLGRSLGFLVGALVIGTALPHLIKSTSGTLPWRFGIIMTSGLAAAGGALLLLLVPNGPFRKPVQKPDLLAFIKVFRQPKLRASAFGYFGHMWELYAFWAFTPFMLETYDHIHPGTISDISIWSFIIIAIGGVGCVIGGYVSGWAGSRTTASVALTVSGICCLISPLIFLMGSPVFFIAVLIAWGFFVIPDSPLFSSLVAKHSEPEVRGTALTIVNSIGFGITIISIQLLNYLHESIRPEYLYVFLGLGPVLGLYQFLRVRRVSPAG